MTAKKKKKTAEKVTKFCQYSKKLSTAITVIWCILRFAVMATSIVRPEIAEAMVELVSGADSVMMVNIGMYTGNSTAEKAILAWMERSKTNTQDDEENAVESDSNG